MEGAARGRASVRRCRWSLTPPQKYIRLNFLPFILRRARTPRRPTSAAGLIEATARRKSDMAQVVVADTTFVSWPQHMHPGHCFVWFSRENLALYSVVVETAPLFLGAGYRLTRTFGGPFPGGRKTYVRQSVAALLLSEEQMVLARTLGWPNDERSLRRVFAVPSS
jgi:hypothetical protein